MSARASKYGVYPDEERLVLPVARKNWRGVNQAEIALCKCEDGWRGAVSFAFMCGDHWGSFSPISASDTAYPSREECVAAMIERLCAKVGKVTHPEMVKVARRIEEWARSLIPEQAELFATLAEAGGAGAVAVRDAA